MVKRWRIRPHDSARVAQLERSANISAILAQLLVARGVEDPTEVQNFLEARFRDLRDPELLPGLSVAADRLHAAIKHREPITVYGDYDADGMTATSILWRCMSVLGADVEFYVPNRLSEGYGLNADALRTLAQKGRKVIVTVDCGIASVEEANLAREIGIDLIISDHHQVGREIPNAFSIVHPSLPGTNYACTNLCGAGVAFKIAWALCQRADESKRVSPRLRNFLLSAIGLAAIGTVADVVPLLDENRLIVRHGLNSLTSCPLPGIAAMIALIGLDKQPEIASEDVAFMIAPRLNAAGRLGQAELAVELMTTDSTERAQTLADHLNQLNGNRDRLERSIYLAAQKQATESFDPTEDPALVLASRGWHTGVIGIVAGRLAEKYCRPVVMIALDELGHSIGTGSARSAWGLNLYEALSDCAEHLVRFGGHAAAAGLRIDEAHIGDFRKRFCERVREQVSPAERVAEINVDAETTLPQLTIKSVLQMEQLAPFGQSNPRPLLCATGVQLVGPPKKMGGGDRHLMLKVAQHSLTLRAVAFGQGDWFVPLNEHKGLIDIAFRPVLNHFAGRRSVEVQLVDWRPTAAARFASTSK